MDQIKIGRFIASQRKEKNMTQKDLAKQLHVSDKTVSAWENGTRFPGIDVLIPLCNVLCISVNDLLSGEVVNMDDYKQKLEDNLLEMIKKKEQADKMLLRLEIIVGLICVGVMLALCMIAAYVAMAEWLRIVLIIIGVLPVVVALPFLIKIEQTAGYYVCPKCGHQYIPKYSSVFMAMHMGRTRYMKCPVCKENSWQRKTITKETND